MRESLPKKDFKSLQSGSHLQPFLHCQVIS